MSLISELKRRNVIKVAVLYVVASWLILQVADVLFGQLGLPDWAFRFTFGMLVICFPLVLLFSWVFEITPEGLRRESSVEEGRSITPLTGQRINKAIVYLLALTIAVVGLDRLIPERASERPAGVAEAGPGGEPPGDATPAATTADKSIAVLPFVNMSGDQDNEYFSDGLTEELLNSLARVEELKVAGRTSSFAFKGQNLDLREIARQLDVAHLLEGSVRKAGNQVRITAQLVKASDGYHLWSETYDRELDDIFKLQEDIAERVAEVLQARLLHGPEDSPLGAYAPKPDAWEAYLRGRYLLRGAPDDEATRRRSEASFLHALNVDAGFTLARWGLFQVLDFRHRNGVVDYQAGIEDMDRLSQQMLDEAPELPESHLARSRFLAVSFRLVDARRTIEEALRLQPGNIDALMALSGLESALGKRDAALELRLQALRLDPLAIPAISATAGAYAASGRCEEAAAMRDRALELQPQAGRVNAWVSRCLAVNGGDLQQAIRLARSEPVGFLRNSLLAILLHRAGDTAGADAQLAELQGREGDAASYQYGQVYAQWGQPELAVEWLNKAWTAHDPGIINLYGDPLLEPLQNDTGFLTLQRQWMKAAGL